MFPEKEYQGLSPDFHIHASVSDLYIPTIGLLEEICRPILWLYKSLTDTWMWRLGLRPRYFPEKEYMSGIFVAVEGDPFCQPETSFSSLWSLLDVRDNLLMPVIPFGCLWFLFGVFWALLAAFDTFWLHVIFCG